MPGPSAGRRYRGLSAEERRADQRRRLVRAAINEFAARGYHRTSVEDIVRSARTSRTAFYAFFDNREDAMYGALQTSLRGLLDDVRKAMRRAGPDDEPHRGRRHARTSTSSSPIPRRRGSCCSKASARRPRSTRLRAEIRRELADLIRDIWAEYDPEAAAAPQARGGLGRRVRHPVRVDAAPRRDRPARRGAREHVPALVTAVERILEPRRLTLGAAV